MHNELQMGGILGGLLGTLALCAIVFVVLLALAYVHWVFSGGFIRWHRARQDRVEAAAIEAEDQERALERDQARQMELQQWVQQGSLPSPITRLYPAYQEFTWEWGRLQGLGYAMDHDPVQLDDGQLMVTYSRLGRLRVAQ